MHSRSFAPPCSRQTVCGSKENGRPSNRRRGAGIKLAGADGKSAFVWLFLSYVLQSIGELLIMPIGYPEPTGTTAVATNPEYAKLFAELGAGSLAVGIALVVLIPFLRKLITDKAETTPAVTTVPVVPVA